MMNKISIGRISDASGTFYTLWIDDTITCAVSVKKSAQISFIDCVDSTGCNRGYNKEFIQSVVRSIKGFVYCFSYPKDELIFGKSALNHCKKINSPHELFYFWKECFEKRCFHEKKPIDSIEKSFEEMNDRICYVSSWSCFDDRRSYPFKSIDDLPDFQDDPISKMKTKIPCLNDMFEGLLYRMDFMKGGLLFSNCCASLNRCMAEDSFEYYLKKMDMVISTNRISASDGTVSNLVEFLSKSDFSTAEKAKETSGKLKSLFNLQFVDVDTNIKRSLKKEETVQPISIKTRKLI